MELQFEKIGLFGGVHEVCYLLPYAKIFLPEIQSKLDSRKSMTAERVADYFLRYIERQRKVGVQMWADTQIDDSADKRFRSLADKLIEVQGKRDYYDRHGRLVRTVYETTKESNSFSVALFLYLYATKPATPLTKMYSVFVVFKL